MLQFILGDITANKQQWIIQDLSHLLDNGSVKNIFYLVPDHIKFDSELSVLSHLMGKNSTLGGSICVQIYSFSRLAWFLLKDTGLLSKTSLSKTGLSMLMRHILTEHEQELVIYRGDIHHTGFIEQLIDLFLELRSGSVTTDDLQTFEAHYAKQKTIQNNQQKISELNRLYRLFNDKLIGQYLEKEDLYDDLVQHILQMDFSQTAVYIYGYHRFTAKEQAIVLALLKRSYKVAISLALEPQDINATTFKALSYVPHQTYQRLLQAAKQNQIKIAPIVQVTVGKERYQPEMIDVLAYWRAIYQEGYYYTDVPVTQEALIIKPFASKQAEIEAVANEIVALMATGNYRYKDIHVLMRQVEDYEMMIKPIFMENHIPVFIDNAESMAYHPLVEWISALYHLQKRNWQYQDVMRLLRTELLPFGARQAVDFLENELLANGYQGKFWWTHEEAWENQVLREHLTETLLPFQEKLSAAWTMKEASIILYRFMEEMQISQKLMAWRDELLDNGQLERARQHEQAWDTFCHLLDEFVMILGQHPFDLDLFYTVLFDGFEQAEYSAVPPTLDQVTISSLDTNRENASRIVFVLGASAEQFPKSYENVGLLSHQEREIFSSLLQDNAFLALNSTYRTLIEPFVAYQVFASATDKLYLFYPQVQQDVSPYITLLERRFKTEYRLSKYGRSLQVMRQVLGDIRYAFDKKQSISVQTKALMHYFEQHETMAPVFNWLKQGFTYKNIPVSLTLANQLYLEPTEPLALSVSRLESYFKDPYSYFLQYGLRLKERQLLALKPADIGNVFHDTLDCLYTTLRQQQKTIEQLTDNELAHFTTTVLEDIFSRKAYRLFQHNNRMQFSKYLLSETLMAVIKRLYRYAKQIPVQTLLTEQTFSSRQDSQLMIPPISLEQNQQLILRGKIDRVDLIANQFISVIDYKSSHQRFQINRFFEGLSLQLVTYLYVMQHNKQRLQLADKEAMGAFYYHITNGYELVKDIMVEQDDTTHQSTKLTGLLTLDALNMETIDEAGEFYQAKLTKNKTYHKNMTMPLALGDELNILFEYLTLKIKEAGERILAGDIRLQPFEDEAFIPSLKEFRSISLFDATLPENRYRQLDKSKDMMEKIRGKVAKDDSTN